MGVAVQDASGAYVVLVCDPTKGAFTTAGALQ
jgi:hypothetical protein